MAKQTYKNPSAGQPLLTVISAGCKTPLLEVKFCTLLRPFYYPNSPSIARYSITCTADPEEHKEFLKGLQAIEKNEKVDSIIKNDCVKEDGAHITTGLLNIKFQTKDIIPIYQVNADGTHEKIELDDELARGEKVVVIYEILRYTKKNTIKVEHGLSFKPTCIYYYPTEEAQKTVKV